MCSCRILFSTFLYSSIQAQAASRHDTVNLATSSSNGIKGLSDATLAASEGKVAQSFALRSGEPARRVEAVGIRRVDWLDQGGEKRCVIRVPLGPRRGSAQR